MLSFFTFSAVISLLATAAPAFADVQTTFWAAFQEARIQAEFADSEQISRDAVEACPGQSEEVRRNWIQEVLDDGRRQSVNVGEIGAAPSLLRSIYERAMKQGVVGVTRVADDPRFAEALAYFGQNAEVLGKTALMEMRYTDPGFFGQGFGGPGTIADANYSETSFPAFHDQDLRTVYWFTPLVAGCRSDYFQVSRFIFRGGVETFVRVLHEHLGTRQIIRYSTEASTWPEVFQSLMVHELKHILDYVTDLNMSREDLVRQEEDIAEQLGLATRESFDQFIQEEPDRYSVLVAEVERSCASFIRIEIASCRDPILEAVKYSWDRNAVDNWGYHHRPLECRAFREQARFLKSRYGWDAEEIARLFFLRSKNFSFLMTPEMHTSLQIALPNGAVDLLNAIPAVPVPRAGIQYVESLLNDGGADPCVSRVTR